MIDLLFPSLSGTEKGGARAGRKHGGRARRLGFLLLWPLRQCEMSGLAVAGLDGTELVLSTSRETENFSS